MAQDAFVRIDDRKSEPWKDVNEAIRAGTARHLNPGESLDCEVRVVLFEGSDPLNGFTDDGSPLR